MAYDGDVERSNDLPAIALGAVATVVVALLLAPFRDDVGGANVALVLVLVIIATAAVGGRRAGVPTAVVASLSFNFLHTQPYLSLRIDGPQDVVTFVLLLVVGVAVGELAHLAARRGRAARVRTQGIAGLHELSQLVAAHASAEVVIDRASAYLVRELHLASCSFRWGDEPAPRVRAPAGRGLAPGPGPRPRDRRSVRARATSPPGGDVGGPQAGDPGGRPRRPRPRPHPLTDRAAAPVACRARTSTSLHTREDILE